MEGDDKPLHTLQFRVLTVPDPSKFIQIPYQERFKNLTLKKKPPVPAVQAPTQIHRKMESSSAFRSLEFSRPLRVSDSEEFVLSQETRFIQASDPNLEPTEVAETESLTSSSKPLFSKSSSARSSYGRESHLERLSDQFRACSIEQKPQPLAREHTMASATTRSNDSEFDRMFLSSEVGGGVGMETIREMPEKAEGGESPEKTVLTISGDTEIQSNATQGSFVVISDSDDVVNETEHAEYAVSTLTSRKSTLDSLEATRLNKFFNQIPSLPTPQRENYERIFNRSQKDLNKSQEVRFQSQPGSKEAASPRTIPESEPPGSAEQTPAPPKEESAAAESSPENITINISAKINVKIHISTRDDESSEKSSGESPPKPDQDRKKEASFNVTFRKPTPRDKSSTKKKKAETPTNAKQMKDLKNMEKVRESREEGVGFAAKVDEIDEEMEQMLNEVYGNEWKTPSMLKCVSNKKPGTAEKEPTPGNSFFGDLRGDFASTKIETSNAAPVPPAPTSIPVKRTHLVPLEEENPRMVQKNIAPRSRRRPETHDSDSTSSKNSDESWHQSASTSSSDSEREGARAAPKRTKKKLLRKKATPRPPSDVSFSDDSDEEKENLPKKDPPRPLAAVEIPVTPTPAKTTRRKLFTPRQFESGESDAAAVPDQPPSTVRERILLETSDLIDDERVTFKVPPTMILPPPPLVNKKLEAVKNIEPKVAKPKKKEPDTPLLPGIPVYSFLQSLDVNSARSLCDPEALRYRDNYKTRKEDLTNVLFNLYNERVFDHTLTAPITWNKKLLNTAGRCVNSRKGSERSSRIELSEKVLTSADRLRCTLIHEMCHAAVWIFEGENGHGRPWKAWAAKANKVFPELPKINVSHAYDIQYKYTYRCVACKASSQMHSKSKKVEEIRCRYCKGQIEILLNKYDKEGNVELTPIREPTGFAKFVKEKYGAVKKREVNLKHPDIMKILSTEFAAMKTQ